MGLLKFLLAVPVIIQMHRSPEGYPEMLLALLNIFVLFRLSRLRLKPVLLISIPPLVLTVFFFSAAAVTSFYSEGPVNSAWITVHGPRTLFIFWAAVFITRYIGRDGLIYGLTILPSRRVRYFILSLYSRISSLMRISRNTGNQLRARIDISKEGRTAAARYWVYNIIQKEIRSLEAADVSLLMRGNNNFIPVAGRYIPFPGEISLLAIAFMLSAAGIIISMELL